MKHKMTFSELRQLAKEVGVPEARLDLAAAIALGESAGDPRALNNKGGDESYGLWQINMRGRLGESRRKAWGIKNEDLFNPVLNAEKMFLISNHGSDFTPWGAYTNGSYKHFMPATPTPIEPAPPIAPAAGVGVTNQPNPEPPKIMPVSRPGDRQVVQQGEQMPSKSWKLAAALETLRNEINTLYPRRSKASDGSIGDAAHQARVSDHNPDQQGIVHAIDIDKGIIPGDVSRGDAEFQKLVERISNDRRVKYIIYQRRIKNPGGAWRPYSGPNPHLGFTHVSTNEAAHADTGSWLAGIGAVVEPAVKPQPHPHPQPQPQPQPQPAPEPKPADDANRPYPGGPGYSIASSAPDGNVSWIQQRLNAHGAKLQVDGRFGPKTRAAVLDFQRSRKLAATGRVTKGVWDKLRGN